MSFLKGTLGTKRATTNWAVLRECGHVPLQFYWLMSALKIYNGLLNSNCEMLRKVLKADLHLHSGPPHIGLLRSWMAFKDCGAVSLL
eukprot:322044-Pelagomonas_calceolata.AAC.1